MQDFRQFTVMEVLRLAFYLPACWNFSPAFYCAGRRLFLALPGELNFVITVPA